MNFIEINVKANVQNESKEEKIKAIYLTETYSFGDAENLAQFRIAKEYEGCYAVEINSMKRIEYTGVSGTGTDYLQDGEFWWCVDTCYDEINEKGKVSKIKDKWLVRGFDTVDVKTCFEKSGLLSGEYNIDKIVKTNVKGFC